MLATVAILVALGAGGIACGMAFKNNIINMTDQMRIYDSVIHNPTAEEKTILGGILFQEKLNTITKLMIGMFIILKKM